MKKFPEVFTDKQWLHKIESNKLGPTVGVMVCVHGNEKSNLKVVRALKNISIKKGTLYFIGANPRAYQLNKRYIDTNLNREFGNNKISNSYEFKREKIIREILLKCETVIDCHQNYTDAGVFATFEPNSFGLAKKIDAKYIITSDTNAGNKYLSRKFMNKIGKQGLGIEFGNMYDTDQSKNIESGIREIKKLLNEKGMINEKIKQITKPKVLKIIGGYKAKVKFVLDKNIRDFQKLKSGQIIGYDGKKEIRCLPKYDGAIILFATNAEKGAEAFDVAYELSKNSREFLKLKISSYLWNFKTWFKRIFSRK